MKTFVRFLKIASDYRFSLVFRNNPINVQFNRSYSLKRNSVEDFSECAYSSRSHTCGELNVSHVGENVLLCGWLEFQRMNKFAVLRDAYGSTQVIIPEECKDMISRLSETPLESVVAVKGQVTRRPDSQIKNTPTGEVEIVLNEFKVLNPVQKKLPFSIRDYNKAGEHLRMKYRYLDLRYPQMQQTLRKRSQLLMKMREFLINKTGFVEVETPTLFKRTPGGAQEFIVPTKRRGEFYSLVQSPQQLKQLLMVGGMDRYFQIARCYRDETTRPDRQPEFTQVDIEMSFCSLDDVLSLIEDMLFYSWPVPVQFDRMSFTEALRLYGTDQPDITFNCQIFDVETDKTSRNGETIVKAINIPQAAAHFTSSLKSSLMKQIKDLPVRLLPVKVTNDPQDTWFKHLSQLAINPHRFTEDNSILSGDLTFLSVGNDEEEVLRCLGRSRISFLRHLRSRGITGPWDAPENRRRFLWILDFPLFSRSSEGRLEAAHHPFTMPRPDQIHLIDTKPLEVRGLSYDLVLEGYEVGGGSVRIHDPRLQERILDLLDISRENLTHLLEALASGAPPHAGIALGVDRLVSQLVGAQSIRDVIAFPKTGEGRDLMSGAPCPLPSAQLLDYHIQLASSQAKT